MKDFVKWFFVITTLIFLVASLGYFWRMYQEPEGKVNPNTITISELRDEIKKGQPFYLNIDNEKRLRFHPNGYKWWISETLRQQSK